jgi:hypothetical protein
MRRPRDLLVPLAMLVAGFCVVQALVTAFETHARSGNALAAANYRPPQNIDGYGAPLRAARAVPQAQMR